MKFDKSKVCVAGLNEVPIGTKGFMSDSVVHLRDYVENENISQKGTCKSFSDGGYEVTNTLGVTISWSFFYPLPEKQYRPYRTVEEARDVIGKVIHHKLLHRILLITSIEYLDSVNGSEFILINGERADKIFQDYTFKDGSPIGVEV